MNRATMIAMVCLSAYCLLDLVVSGFVAVVWRTRRVAPADLPPAVRGRRVMLLRLTPLAASASIALLIVAPAFALFEPVQENEPYGPMLALLASLAFAHLSGAAVWATFSVWLTRRIARDWLLSSTPLETGSGLRAFAIETSSPLIALVGVFRPALVAARTVIDACTSDEIAAILAHERGHLLSRDNFKRWLMTSLPDTLRWTRIHGEMLDAWHHAAEDAAHDAATGGGEVARADLAAVLLKVVRLTPRPRWRGAVVSPFVERDGLERRVRRLIRPELEPPASFAVIPTIAVTLVVAASLAILSSPLMLESIFEAFEQLVAFGR